MQLDLRIAMAMAVVPEKAQTIHYFKEKSSGEVICYNTSQDFYFQHYYMSPEMPSGISPNRFGNNLQLPSLH
jgi:hypothetical protein